MSIQIILVDDQELVRTGFRMVLEAQPDMTVVGEAADGLAAVEMTRRHPADVVVMDVRMPRLDGLAATAAIWAPAGMAGAVRRARRRAFPLVPLAVLRPPQACSRNTCV